MENQITKEEYRKRVFEKLKKNCSDEHGVLLDKERFDECIENHFENYVESGYKEYSSTMLRDFAKEMTDEEYTKATIDQCVSCLELEY